MRTTKELLELMLEHQDKFYLGLCIWVNNLKLFDTISFDEWHELENYIRNNKPSRFSSWYCFKESFSSSLVFYWEPSNIKPRIKWIKQHIKKLS
jgi:hypothetical protein